MYDTATTEVSYRMVSLSYSSLVILPPASGNHCLQSFAFSRTTTCSWNHPVGSQIAFFDSNMHLISLMPFCRLIAHSFLPFHSMNVPQFIYPFTFWRTSWWLPSFNNYESTFFFFSPPVSLFCLYCFCFYFLISSFLLFCFLLSFSLISYFLRL